uniref:Uncharacterized protein n=1 Tax=Xenopsylla cheopis TaxID=163159 RepID=A0A6M2DPM3_XENCH
MVVQFRSTSTCTMHSSTESPRRPIVKHVGNDLNISINSNINDLILVGNRSRVNIEQNNGSVKIIGDCCKVRILSNLGSVRYVGNRGIVTIGNDSVSHDVKYTGNGGSLKYRDGTDMDCNKITQINEDDRSKKKRRKQYTRIYNSDGALNADAILKNCNKFLNNFQTDLCSRSTDCFVTSGAVVTMPSISVVNGNVTINNYHS